MTTVKSGSVSPISLKYEFRNAIIKNITGGLYNKNDDIYNDYIKNENNIFNKEMEIDDTYEIMDIIESINKRKYRNIEKYIDNCFDRFSVIFNIFYKNEVDTIVKITQNEDFTKGLVRECDVMFENLMYLYATIPFTELYGQLTFNNSINYRSIFNNRMKSYHGIYYEKFRKEFDSEIPLDKWRCIYVVWLINSNIFFNRRYECYKLLKFIFPNLFEKYPIDDFFKLMNIYDAIKKNKSEESE